jgi:hypothetical protein
LFIFFDIGALSHIINFAIRRSLASPFCLLTRHVIFFSTSSEILNLECAVRSPDNMDATTPDDAVAMTTKCFDFIVARIAL